MAGVINKFFIILFLFLTSMSYAKERKPPDYVLYGQELVNTFAQEVRQKYGLVCIGSGGGYARDVEEIDVLFHAYRKGTQEEARRLEIELTELLIERVNQCEKIRPFLRDFPFARKRAHVSILFVNKHNDSYNDGSVAHVFQAKDKIFYRCTNSQGKDIEPFAEEPYDAALKIVRDGH